MNDALVTGAASLGTAAHAGQYRAVYLIFRTVSGNPSDPGTWRGELVPLPDRMSNAFVISP
jgi:hypothetical protein